MKYLRKIKKLVWQNRVNKWVIPWRIKLERKHNYVVIALVVVNIFWNFTDQFHQVNKDIDFKLNLIIAFCYTKLHRVDIKQTNVYLERKPGYIENKCFDKPTYNCRNIELLNFFHILSVCSYIFHFPSNVLSFTWNLLKSEVDSTVDGWFTENNTIGLWAILFLAGHILTHIT